MSVVYINGKFLGQRITGVQRYAREMLQGLDQLLSDSYYQNRVQLRLVVPNDVFLPTLNHIQIIQTNHGTGHYWEQVILPHACKNGPLLNLSGSAPIIKFGQYFTIHDAVLYEFPTAYSWKFRLWYRILFSWLARTSRRVYTVSEFSRSRLSLFLPILKDKLLVTTNGHEHFVRLTADNSIIERLNLGGQSYMLMVGSHNPNKNFARLASVISSNFSDKNLLFVLVGDINPIVFNTSALELPENVISAGYVSDEALKALYAHASGFIFPSLYEGFGLPLLEAMSVGCPVLASHAASIPEVCDEAAIYFNPVDEPDIANTMSVFLGDKSLRHNLSVAGLERVKLFTWSNSAKRLLDDLLEQEFVAQ